MEEYKITREYIIKEFWGKKPSNISDEEIDAMDEKKRKEYQRYVKAKILEPNALDGGKLALTIGNQVKKDADIAKLLDEIIPYLRKYVVLIYQGNFGKEIELNLYDNESTINDMLDHRQLLDICIFFVMEMCLSPLELWRIFSPLLSSIEQHIDRIGGGFNLFFKSLMQGVSTHETLEQSSGESTQNILKSGTHKQKKKAGRPKNLKNNENI
ncbi:MAG: hypothetical protein EBX50_01440 [Chitinophagia bacterium]|nr:hypothetical protein [Chitinophagia bacterium]